ncbi:carbonic anhydrase 14-like isoform X2 [Pristis pectinata]|uniref:carbonic anhydrase 14-like isoform X2 n=1 Tax=Pristis pectinata TaxID=685728 RepID=UPI00223E5B20|nr:carbonic anhydrase 14-like isoform X2 [Pristis pectinata]
MPAPASHWEYDGPLGVKHWHEEFAHCGKEAQSPINIQTQYVHYDRSLKPVRLKGYSDPQCNTFHLSNNGHTVQMELPSTMVISSLPKRYRATQLHFHWGSLVWPSGSEHLIDGERAPAELHIVHYNTEKYRNMSEAMTKPDGLVVLGILLEVGNLKNPAYENILSHLESVTFAGQEVEIPSFDVRSLLPKRLDQYFTYRGSLTTPPCFQSVRWIVFHQRVPLSLSQFKTLRTGLFHTLPDTMPRLPLVNNFREVQPLGNRRVKASFPVGWAVNFRKAVRKLLKMLSAKLHD